MKAVEVTGVVDEQGNLSLHGPVPAFAHGTVRVIILYPEPTEEGEEDPDNTSIEEIKANLRRALHQAKTGQRMPLAQMWEGIDTE